MKFKFYNKNIMNIFSVIMTKAYYDYIKNLKNKKNAIL